MDMLVNLKLVAKESGHAKSGFFDAVLKVMRDKTSYPGLQFKKYLEALLGDKDHEKVLDTIAKVDKASRVASTSRGPFRMAPYSSRVGRGRAARAFVECYLCHQLGHYQAYCPSRFARAGPGQLAAKRSKPGQDQDK